MKHGRNGDFMNGNSSALQTEIDKLPINMPQLEQIAFGITLFGGKVHESITKEAAKQADMPYGNMIEGVQWPDAPSDDSEKISKSGTLLKMKQPGNIANDSHFGKYQYWHSMTPDDGTGRVYSNGEVKDLIINQAVAWYEQAQSSGDTFHLGKVLHMVQDSYSRSHVVRDENGNIKNFQSYNEQDGHAHGLEDKPHIKTVIESNGIGRQVPEDWRKYRGLCKRWKLLLQYLSCIKAVRAQKSWQITCAIKFIHLKTNKPKACPQAVVIQNIKNTSQKKILRHLCLPS